MPSCNLRVEPHRPPAVAASPQRQVVKQQHQQQRLHPQCLVRPDPCFAAHPKHLLPQPHGLQQQQLQHQ
jgi:hypothetical protein